MEKLEIIGTRLTICFSNKNDLVADLGSFTKGYRYKDVLGFDSGSSAISVNNISMASDDNYIWLYRDTKKHTGQPRILKDYEFDATIRLAYYYANKIMVASSSWRKTYYHGVLETLLAFSGSDELLNMYKDSTVSIGILRDTLLKSIKNLPLHGKSIIIKDSYRRYSLADFAEDLVRDGAKLIMDDSIYAYNWQGRKSQGFGNIKPIIETTDLYPTYKITGIQGNQTNANLSIKFDFKANYDTGSSIKVLEISRNLMMVQNGCCFQNMIALHVSKNLKNKLERLSLIDTKLPGPGDIIVDLSRIAVSSRKNQRNRTNVGVFVDAACMYNICKEELEKIEGMINWTQAEITRATEKAKASQEYWALNQTVRRSVSSGKKLYSVNIGSTPTIPSGLTQDQLRELRKTLIKKQSESYNLMTSLIFNFLTSKKTIREFLGISKKIYKKIYTTTGLTLSREITSPLGLKYKCKFKFQ